jgi:dephospho-CoA kinase
MPHEKKVIGVGGGIGSGKTTVSEILAEFGARYISADEIGWEVLADIKDELKNKFGNEIMKDNDIDRKKLRSVVFSEREHLRTLNAMSHPLLKERLLRRIDAVTHRIVVVDAALLFEWPDVLDHIDVPILVTADDRHKERRAREKGIERDKFQNIQNMQQRDQEMKAYARYVITNNGTLDDLRKRCRTIYKEIVNDC